MEIHGVDTCSTPKTIIQTKPKPTKTKPKPAKKEQSQTRPTKLKRGLANFTHCNQYNQYNVLIAVRKADKALAVPMLSHIKSCTGFEP